MSMFSRNNYGQSPPAEPGVEFAEELNDPKPASNGGVKHSPAAVELTAVMRAPEAPRPMTFKWEGGEVSILITANTELDKELALEHAERVIARQRKLWGLGATSQASAAEPPPKARGGPRGPRKSKDASAASNGLGETTTTTETVPQ